MSQFLPETPQSAQQSTDFKPVVETPTLDGDVALMQRIFSAAVTNPSQIPSDFLAYLVDFLQTQRLNIPIGQVFGFSQFTAQASTVVTSESTASTTYTDLATPGPLLEGLPKGRYVIFYGADIFPDTAGNSALCSVSVNGAAAADADMIDVFGSTGGAQASVSRALVENLSVDGGNTVEMKYRVASAGNLFARNRWLVALKYGN